MFKYLIIIVGLLLASCAAIFSVKGLSQLFIGGGVIITIMASILEGAKILTVSILERYWGVLSKLLKTYLISAVLVLMVITSAGIYGLLANGYQATFNELDKNEYINNSLNEKIFLINESIETAIKNKEDKENENKRLSDERLVLNEMRSGKNFQYTNANGDVINSIKSLTNSEKRSIEIDLNEIKIRQDKNNQDVGLLNNQITTFRDSINTLNIQIIDNKVNENIGGEIGSLIYLSELTNKPMNVIVNYLILLIVFIFDPLAITLIIVANKLQRPNKKEIIENIKDEVETKLVVPNNGNNVDTPEVVETKKKSAKDIIDEETNRKFSVKIPNKQVTNGGGQNTIQRI